MADAPMILRSGTHKSRGDTLELWPDALVIRGQHSRDRKIAYGDIANLEVREYRGRNRIFPNAPESMLVSLTLSRVPEFTGLQKRSPRVADSYYLSEELAFDLTRREEVLTVVGIIDQRRKSVDPIVPAFRHTFIGRPVR
ncbi:hypothetical protein [Sphingomonas pruni]|uniref:hypothetical protein n=1 Tax=Sphingomonas pruni TaxID=40683 RepID=UPI0008340945|nr:hypothetical protein [Sphingomonas pruni]